MSNSSLNYLEILCSDLQNELESKSSKISSNEYIIKIHNLIEEILSKKIQEQCRQYISTITFLEKTNKHLIQQNFLKQTKIDILENEIDSYIEMEEEFEEMKIKFKYQDGKFLNNEKKENEILILRAENSNLKKTILNKEKLIEEKDKIIENYKKTILKSKEEFNNNSSSKLSSSYNMYSSFSKIRIPNKSNPIRNTNNLIKTKFQKIEANEYNKSLGYLTNRNIIKQINYYNINNSLVKKSKEKSDSGHKMFRNLSNTKFLYKPYKQSDYLLFKFKDKSIKPSSLNKNNKSKYENHISYILNNIFNKINKRIKSNDKNNKTFIFKNNVFNSLGIKKIHK